MNLLTNFRKPSGSAAAPEMQRTRESHVNDRHLLHSRAPVNLTQQRLTLKASLSWAMTGSWVGDLSHATASLSSASSSISPLSPHAPTAACEPEKKNLCLPVSQQEPPSRSLMPKLILTYVRLPGGHLQTIFTACI